MEPPKDPQTTEVNHTEKRLTNIVGNNLNHLENAHELISHLVEMGRASSAADPASKVNFSALPGYAITPSNKNPKQVVLHKANSAKMDDKGKDDVASDHFEVHILVTPNGMTANIGVPDHAGEMPSPILPSD